MQVLAGPGDPGDGSWPKLGVTADIHLENHKRFGGPIEAGMNRRGREHVDTFRRAGLFIRGQCDAHFVCGDTFDNEKPRPQHEAAAQDVLKLVPSAVLVGNHDQNSAAAGDHACAPLAPVAVVVEAPTIFTYARGKYEVWCVPFLTMGEQAGAWLPKVLDEMHGSANSDADFRVLMLHMGIADKDTPPWLTRGHNWIDVHALDELTGKHKIDVVIAGDWHEHKRWDLNAVIVQVGALVPTGFDNPGLEDYGSVITIDEMGEVYRTVIPGPRFIQAPSVQAAELPDDDSTVYLEVTAHYLDVADQTSKLAELKKAGVFVDGEVRTSKEDIELEARDAARSARSADTLKEAITAFVDRMPLPANANRESVHARIGRFLS